MHDVERAVPRHFYAPDLCYYLVGQYSIYIHLAEIVQYVIPAVQVEVSFERMEAIEDLVPVEAVCYTGYEKQYTHHVRIFCRRDISNDGEGRYAMIPCDGNQGEK